MLTKNQLNDLSKKYKINETVILREYIQLLALNKIYSFPKSSNIFFKGGTCLHLAYKAPRFSEDLDFNVGMDQNDFLVFIKIPFKELEKENGFIIREKKTLAGKTFLLKYETTLIGGAIYVKFDFSFREKTLDPQKNIIETDFPVLFNNYINCLSEEEILSEKVRAILTRDKGRDFYDLWFLLSKNINLNFDFINKKLKFYSTSLSGDKKELKNKVEKLDAADFVIDLRPFVPINERDKLKDFCGYIKDFILRKI